MTNLLRVLGGEKVNPPPVWLMRQAGRYLPEYRELRAGVPDFLSAVFNPEMAAEITLQPLRRFPQIDAAILFSDILVTPLALGRSVRFVKGEGPQLDPLQIEDVTGLKPDTSVLQPVYETVSRVRAALTPEQTLIGFAGSPWTVACYMICGGNIDDFQSAKLWALSNGDALDALLDKLVDVTVEYLLGQIAAGAQVLQLFESWASLLAGHAEAVDRFIIKPTAKIVAAVRAQYPQVPIIGFPRAIGTDLVRYAERTGVQCVGLDWSVDLQWVDDNLPAGFPVQGNLDPLLLFAGGDAMRMAAQNILRALDKRPLIFNLGHGVMQFTAPEHVGQLLEVVKA